MIGGVVALVGLVAAVALFIAHAPLPMVALSLVISVAGAYYVPGSKSGYYEVAQDGSLGDYLGRRVPDLSWMRRVKTS